MKAHAIDLLGLLNYSDPQESRVILQKMVTLPTHQQTFSVKSSSYQEGRVNLATLTPSGAERQGKYQTLLFDGVLYNRKEILDLLSLQDHGQSNAELLSLSLEKWGEDVLLKFNGSFAFAYWDTQKQELLLGKDRLGSTPLYYAQIGEQFFFTSDLRYLLAGFGDFKNVDPYALTELFFCENILPPRTLLSGVSTVCAAETVKIKYESKGFQIQRKSYWKLDTPKEIHYNQDIFHNLLSKTIKEYSTDSMGYFHQGGVESGALYALLKEVDAEFIPTFSPCYQKKQEGDSSPQTNQFKQLIEEVYREKVLSQKDWYNGLPKASLAMNSPCGSGWESGFFQLFELAQKEVSNLITSTGLKFFLNLESQKEQIFDLPLKKALLFLFQKKFVKKIHPIEYIKDQFIGLSNSKNSLLATSGEKNSNQAHWQLGHLLPMKLSKINLIARKNGLAVHFPFADYRVLEYLWGCYSTQASFSLSNHLKKIFPTVPSVIWEQPKTDIPHPHKVCEESIYNIYDSTQRLVWYMRRNTQINKVLQLYPLKLSRLVKWRENQEIASQPVDSFHITALTFEYLCKEYQINFNL